MLDLWQGDTDATAAATPDEGTELPATFGETFGAAWNEGRLFGQSIAGENARMDAIDDHVDAVKQATGKDIGAGIDWSGAAAMGGPAPDSFTVLNQINDAAAKIGQPALSPDQLEKNAVAKSRAAQSAYTAMDAREKAPGGSIGMFLGGAAAQATDPLNLVAMTVAPEAEGAGVLAAAVRWGVVAGVSQAGIEATGGPYREEVEPGYEAQAALPNILSATGEGFVLGGATRALGNLWTRVKTGTWPQSVRDAGNVVESEADIAGSNVYPGAAGEVAHREALSASIDSILKGEPVDVAGVTPEMEAAGRSPTMRVQGEGAIGEPSGETGAGPPRIDATHDVVSGADSTRDGTVLIDRHIPQFSPTLKDASGEPADLWKYLAVHERTEADAMAKGMPYLQAHEQVATPAERAAVEADGVSWKAYTDEIDGYLDHIEHEKVSNPPPADTHVDPEAAIGHHRAANKQVRAVPVEATRVLAGRLAEEAKGAGTVTSEVQPALPFEATAAQARADTASGVLADGVAQISRRAGYAMPADEAATVAARLATLTPERAQGALRDLQVSPRGVAEWAKGPAEAVVAPRMRVPAEGAQVPVSPVDEFTLASPAFDAALRADIDRERAAGDVQIPVDVDKDGNPVMRGVDAAMNEVDAYKAAAEQIASCAAPEPAEPEAEAA